MTSQAPGKVSKNICDGKGKKYRLWCKTRIKGKSIVILVHGAVVPSLSGLHRIDYPNSDKFCFYNLDDLLFHDFQYNVFTFDYADEPIGGLGYVNYGSLEDYGKMLIEAIGKARNFTETSDGSAGQVYVIAHSMGGLVARYAVQNIKDIKVRKIITLDTGHHGFELAKIADQLVVDKLQGLIKLPTLCSKCAEPDNSFITALTNGYSACPPLVSLAATQPIQPGELGEELGVPLPPVQFTVVGLESSNMGEVYPLTYSHMSIAKILSPDHDAYKTIKMCLSQDSVNEY